MDDYDRIVAGGSTVTAEKESALEAKSRALTPAEQEELEHELDRNRTESKLRDLIQTWGIAQYAFAPLAFILSLVLFLHATADSARIGHALLALLSAGAISLMLYRGYFTSLGW